MRRIQLISLALLAAILAASCSSPAGARDIVLDVAPSVVTVTKTELTAIIDDQGRVLETGEVPTGTGSGVVIDDEGHVLTNAHVVEDASSVFVVGVDGIQRSATVIATATGDNDLAILELENFEGLEPVDVGSSEDMVVGDFVLAVGNPLGIGLTATAGILSGVDRNIRTEFGELYGVLQTDAAINPGNSGGPLLNDAGELVGINSAGIPDAQSIGFAIPVEQAIPFAEEALGG